MRKVLGNKFIFLIFFPFLNVYFFSSFPPILIRADGHKMGDLFSCKHEQSKDPPFFGPPFQAKTMMFIYYWGNQLKVILLSYLFKRQALKKIIKKKAKKIKKKYLYRFDFFYKIQKMFFFFFEKKVYYSYFFFKNCFLLKSRRIELNIFFIVTVIEETCFFTCIYFSDLII